MIKSKKKRNIHITVVLLLVVLLVLAFRVDLKVVSYDLHSSKIQDDIKIALIADLHSCDYGEGQADIVNMIKKNDPDLVLLGGDIVDDVLPRQKAMAFLAAVSKDYPCYYVSGNHEFWSGEIDEIKAEISAYGITVLEGEQANIEINGQTISLFGIDDPEIGEGEFARQLQYCGEHTDDDRYSILLTHRPERIDSYLEYDFDMVLAGHAHGGQWRIPGILNGLSAPDQGLFPKYAGGQYEFEHTKMIVSRGLARESTRIPRIFNRPEIVFVTLSSIGNTDQ
jgi:predicted MPP superfamily phosphohydrolase